MKNASFLFETLQLDTYSSTQRQLDTQALETAAAAVLPTCGL